MKEKTEIQVGVVDEISNGSMRANPAVDKWHFGCKKCGQKLRIPARREVAFVCVSCRQSYSANFNGQVFMEVSATPAVNRSKGERDDVSLGVSLTSANSSLPDRVAKHESKVNRGLFDKLASGVAAVVNGTAKAASDANEAARGAVLLREYKSTMQGMQELNENLQALTLMKYVDKISKLKYHSVNWTREGCIKMARTLQKEARKRVEFNMAEGYALWLAGAWLETKWRASLEADFIHLELEGMWARINAD